MTFIYDILLNFQTKLYDFYEWNKSDQILHIKKVPLFKINNTDYLNIKNNIVKFEKTFLNKIHNCTIIFKKRKIIDNVFLITNDIEIIAVKLNRKGELTHLSCLLPDEAEDIISISENIEETKIPYEIIKPNNNDNFKTRLEIEKQINISNILDQLYKQNDTSKLSFLYLECFGKTENNITKILPILKQEINENTSNYDKIISFIELIKKG